MVSMMDILSGALPLIVDVRQSGSGPRLTDAGLALRLVDALLTSDVVGSRAAGHVSTATARGR
jgi:hypothetical protein